jgi:hypothetical protein
MTFDKLVKKIMETETGKIIEQPDAVLLGNSSYAKELMSGLVEQKTGWKPIYPGETVMGIGKIKNFYETLNRGIPEPNVPYKRKTKPEPDYRKFD